MVTELVISVIMVPFEEILDYELRSAWWPHWISNRRMQRLVAIYFVWKTQRKYGRWQASLAMKARVEMRRDMAVKELSKNWKI